MIKSALLSCEWLIQNLDDENLVVLDATFFLSRQQWNAREEYLQHHILGALFFDIDEVSDVANSLPHTLPNAERFADAVGEMGIDNNTLVLIYDNNHFFAAARVWWMFRVFGHEQVRILDGGLTRWMQLNFPINSVKTFPSKKTFYAHYRAELFFDLRQMVDAQKTGFWQIIDARSADSFLGQRPFADPCIRLGHIPDSINIPYANLTDCDQQTLLLESQIQTLFKDAHINLSQPIVTTCGSGVSAAVLALALYQIGLTKIPVYDGSWAEWGRQIDTPKQTAL